MTALFLLIVIALTVGLILQIQSTHDCAHGKQCSHTAEIPTKDDSFDVKLEKIQLMIKNCDSSVTWTMALLVGMIAPFPIMYYINDRLPEPKEWIFITVIVFIVSYFGILWITTHFQRPNLIKLQDVLYDFGIQHGGKKDPYYR